MFHIHNLCNLLSLRVWIQIVTLWDEANQFQIYINYEMILCLSVIFFHQIQRSESILLFIYWLRDAHLRSDSIGNSFAINTFLTDISMNWYVANSLWLNHISQLDTLAFKSLNWIAWLVYSFKAHSLSLILHFAVWWTFSIRLLCGKNVVFEYYFPIRYFDVWRHLMALICISLKFSSL